MSALQILLILVSFASTAALVYALAGLLSAGERKQKAALQRKIASIAALQQPNETAALGLVSPRRQGVLPALIPVPVYEWLQKLIDWSAINTSPERVVRMVAALTLSVGLVFLLLTGSLVLSVLLAILAGFLPIGRLQVKAARRLRLFEAQFPEALDFMARALRSGHGLTMAFQIVSEELPAPVSEEFKRVCDELNFGNSFQEALSKMPDRIRSPDLSFFVLGILIQRETGGNLSDLLRTLSNTVRDRLKLQGKVRTLAAEGKFSGILLGSMPFVLAGILTLINPTYMGALWFTPAGQKSVMVGAVFLTLGFFWMRKIAQIRV